ncbi:hypothetical protein B0I37DRAFT_344991 [Chaetomium sp. MPI-CAGE-AT-0009]|nr:hypothetical protein B0I37DRAFT_344991 [Chaetomium sp. MPI-CAGE-AT-0009]
MEKPADGRSIFEATSACRQRLRECIDNPALMADEWSRKRLADFNLWASDSGALAKKRASLDQRLEKHTVREVIVNLLSLLESLLARCQSLAFETPADRDEEINLPEMLENIEDIMAQLVRISVAIRGAGLRARFERADHSFNPERHVELKRHLEFLVHAASLDQGQKEGGNIGLVLSRTMTDIVQRLITANLVRRHRYLYARRRWTKQAAEHEAAAEPRLVPEGTKSSGQAQTPLASRPAAVVPRNEGSESKMILSAPSVITSTVPTAMQGPIQLPHEGRQLSMTAPSSTSSKAVYPKPPKIREDTLFFRCPCCFQTLPVTLAKRSLWRKHLSEDIQPYTCILDECPKPLQLYLTRKEWAQHMREEHEASKYWLCSACLEPTRFDLESHFDTHLRTQHGDVVQEDQIHTFVSMSTYTSPPSFLSCPLCPQQPDDEEVDSDAILDHAAEHVHSFSLQSLPWPIPEEGEREYLGLSTDDFWDSVDYFDVASDGGSAEDSSSSNSQESRDADEMGEASNLVFQDENPDVPWEPYRGEEDSPRGSADSSYPTMKDNATRLAMALKGHMPGPDKEPLIDILPGLTHDQIMELRREYKLLVRAGSEQKGVNLAKHIRVRLGAEDDSDLMKACYATALGRWESEAYWVNLWYHHEKVRRELLTEALMGRTNNEIRLIKDGFRDKKYHDSLTRCIQVELTEDVFKEAILLVLDEERMEETDGFGQPLQVDSHVVRDDVKRLRGAVYGTVGNREALILTIVTGRSDSHLREVVKVYKEIYAGDFLKEAVMNTQYQVREVLAHILNGIINKPARDATLLHHALTAFKGDDSRRVLLISRLIRLHWDSAHMETVKETYRGIYGKDLQEAVRDATTGELGAFCETLCITRVPGRVRFGPGHVRAGATGLVGRIKDALLGL